MSIDKKAQAPQEQPKYTEYSTEPNPSTPESLRDLPDRAQYIEDADATQYGIGNPPRVRHESEIPRLDRKETKGFSTLGKIGLGVVATSLVAGGVVFGTQALAAKKLINSIEDGGRNVSAPQYPGTENNSTPVYGGTSPQETSPNYSISNMESMNAIQFAQLDAETRIDYIHDRFDMDAERARAKREMQPWLDEEGKALINRTLPEEKTSYTTEDILSEMALTMWASSTLSESDGGLTEGSKMYSIAMSPKHPGFKSGLDWLENGTGPLMDLYRVAEDYPQKQSTEFDGHDFDNSLVQFAEIESITNTSNPSAINLFQLVRTPDDAWEWVLLDNYKTDMEQEIRTFLW